MSKKASLTIDLEEIKKVFEEDDSKKGKLGLALVERAIFMQDTLKKLEEKVEQDGVITEMCQGSYNIQRANPALQAYNNTIKNYTSAIKQIADLLPKGESTADEFEEFSKE